MNCHINVRQLNTLRSDLKIHLQIKKYILLKFNNIIYIKVIYYSVSAERLEQSDLTCFC